MPTSQARRVADALEAAHGNVKDATSAAGRHRHRSRTGGLPQQIADLYDLVAAFETLQYLTHDLGKAVKACADDIRAHYSNGHTSDGELWPDNISQAGADADQALSKLRGYLDKTPIAASHQAMVVLHGFLRNMQRATGSS
jgi:hypothetical protein